jgi:hypothetical protein
VKTVFENIKVVCNIEDKRTAEIMTAENTFKWHWDIPTGKVTVIRKRLGIPKRRTRLELPEKRCKMRSSTLLESLELPII